ncbi:MAG: hypothetical protein ABSC23_09960 [Bryobacteraceae bacterium]|jgi:hypothetical protein
MTPGDPVAGAAPPPAVETSPLPQSAYRWYHKLTAVVFATFCLEIGFFLVVFPWTSYAADFAAFKPAWQPYWYNPYMRCAITALGLVNLYIAFVEIFRLRRFAGK